jgi:hypothetical protein
MHAVSEDRVVVDYFLRNLDGLLIVVRQVHDLLALYTEDVMVLRCHRIVSNAHMKGV